MTLRDLILQEFKAKGLDGLYNGDDGCACDASNLAPCGELKFNCTFGKKVPAEEAG